jgi:hypothetical protein
MESKGLEERAIFRAFFKDFLAFRGQCGYSPQGIPDPGAKKEITTKRRK